MGKTSKELHEKYMQYFYPGLHLTRSQMHRAEKRRRFECKHMHLDDYDEVRIPSFWRDRRR